VQADARQPAQQVGALGRVHARQQARREEGHKQLHRGARRMLQRGCRAGRVLGLHLG